ncbi:hypothetical protein [Ralstonia pseudosolanacearum]|uniref:hypothetical protein n=1 Tax=Ralstonia pseudosolanacearum TaxID=1310165 RepID=UPI000ACCCC9F|nr:hypothetical protein [Ralstonia pseudosolanacearum]MDO3576647.1 hypothetical protein [Ralstonia pseudosolanacearum]MDO3588967.1 hypothetical protein [Ralstonia pseudosolanacearum]
MTITISLPYIRIGAREAWIERVSPRQRGAWFSAQRDTSGFHLGLLWWDMQINPVSG